MLYDVLLTSLACFYFWILAHGLTIGLYNLSMAVSLRNFLIFGVNANSKDSSISLLQLNYNESCGRPHCFQCGRKVQTNSP